MNKLAFTVSVALLRLAALSPIRGQESKKIGSSIDGYRYEFPCKGAMPDNPKPGADCDSGLVKGDPKKTEHFTAERKLDGVAGEGYKVTLRFRGVVEPMMYKNGKMDGDLFYVG